MSIYKAQHASYPVKKPRQIYFKKNTFYTLSKKIVK